MTNLVALTAANTKRWSQATILPGRRAEVFAVAKRLVDPVAKARYQAISVTTGVPWFVIAVIHEREASQRWDCQLGQGDPLNQVSRHTPKGRGPFYGADAFYRAAVDALTNCPPYTARWKDWSAGGTMTALIMYNGTGYEDYHHEASPYDWGATNIETVGKYVGDGNFSASTWDTQVGCAAMLKAMMELDPTITFIAGLKLVPSPPLAPTLPVTSTAPPVVLPPHPAPGIWATLLAAIFKRKTS